LSCAGAGVGLVQQRPCPARCVLFWAFLHRQYVLAVLQVMALVPWCSQPFHLRTLPRSGPSTHTWAWVSQSKTSPLLCAGAQPWQRQQQGQCRRRRPSWQLAMKGEGVYLNTPTTRHTPTPAPPFALSCAPPSTALLVGTATQLGTARCDSICCMFVGRAHLRAAHITLMFGLTVSCTYGIRGFLRC
jgi:hypothetical protein